MSSRNNGRRSKVVEMVGSMLISAQLSVGDDRKVGDWRFIVQMNTASGVYRTEGGASDLPIAVDVMIAERSRAGLQTVEWENAWRDKFNKLWEVVNGQQGSGRLQDAAQDTRQVSPSA